MLPDHIELAEFMGVKQNSNEDEYTFRKRAFVKMYPEDAMQAFEMLFCVNHYTEISDKDRMFIVMARDCHTKDGEKGLWKFIKGFNSYDPSKPYVKASA